MEEKPLTDVERRMFKILLAEFEEDFEKEYERLNQKRSREDQFTETMTQRTIDIETACRTHAEGHHVSRRMYCPLCQLEDE